MENTIHQIPILKEANLIEKWTEEEKIPIKKPAPPKPAEEKKDEAKPDEAPKEAPAAETVQEFETKTKKKQITTPLAINTSFFGLLNEQKQKFIEVEGQLYTQDRKFLDLKESKNMLETICYKYRDNLQGAMAPFLED